MDDVATGVHDFSDLKLGSIVGAGLADKRTLNLAGVMNLEIQIPISWDFDKGRSKFPSHMWGNDSFGDCELAARANYLVRLERLETKATPKLTDDDVIQAYKVITGCVESEDKNDTGMTTLTNLGAWRSGWSVTKPWTKEHAPQTRKFGISAYGFVNPQNAHLLRLSSYLFSGAILGCNMPLTAYDQMKTTKVWDVDSSAGIRAVPGSWGGHAIYTKRYDANNVYAITWGQEIKITNAWMEKYCEEAWSVIDDFDSWIKLPQVLDVTKLIKQMKDAGIVVRQ